MANESSGILDGNALFADLPGFMVASPPSSIPPSADPSSGYADVAIYSAPPPTVRRRQATTARSQRQVDPARARLMAIITCGSVALVASLGACFLYVTAPTKTPATASATVRAQ